MGEFLNCGDVGELVECFKETQARAPPSDSSLGKQLMELAIGKTIESKSDAPRKQVCKMLGGLAEKKLLKVADAKSCFSDSLEFIEDDVVDIPHIAAYMSQLIAFAICNNVLPLSFVNEAFTHLVEGEKITAVSMAVEVLKAILGELGEEKARQMYGEAGLKLTGLFPPEAASPTAVVDALDSNGLGALDPELVRTVREQREQEQRQQQEDQRKAQIQKLTEYLRTSLSSDMSTEEVLAWTRENAQSSLEVTRVVMRCVLESASSSESADDYSKAICNQLKRHQTLLKAYCNDLEGTSDGRLKRQAHCLFEVQGFCHEKGFPPGLIKKIFYILYNSDIVFEDAYGVWREDLSEATPGKTKALVQVNEFLEWLEQADEGDEDDDEDD